MAGSGNPYLDILQQGGGQSPGGAPNPVTSAQNSTNKYLNIIRGSGDQGAIQQGQQIAQNKGGHSGSWFSDVVKALDLPRAAVVSGIDTAVHGGGFGQWLKGTTGHETTGHLLNDLGVHNHVLDSIAGIVGDVALDPLTYVGGLGIAGKAAATTGHVVEAVSKAEDASRAAQAVEHSGSLLRAVGASEGDATALAAEHATNVATAAQKAAEAAQATGNGTLTADTLARLQSKGLGALQPEERAFLEQAHPELGSLHAGIGLRVPGTKLAGNPVTIPLAHTDNLSAALHGMASKIADSNTMRGLEEKFIPQGALKSSIRSAALAGDGVRSAALTNLQRALPEAAGVSRQAINEFGPQIRDGLNAVPSDQQHLLPAALEGDTTAREAIRQGGGDISGVQNTLAQMQQKAADMGIPIGKIENYFPHQLTEDARNLFATKSQGQARQAFAGELQRTYKPGSEFLGHTLETGSIDEMNQIAHEVYGKDAVDLFNSNPRDVLANYTRGLSYRMGQQHLANKLDDMGVTMNGDPALAPEDWAKLGETGANAGRQAPQYIKDALDAVRKEATNGGKASPKLLQWYDKSLNVWKQYALAMPGKALRHTVATPGWGMYLGNVGTSSMREAFSAWRTYQKGGIDAIKDEGMRQQIQDFLDQGLSHGHEFHMQDLTGPRTLTGKINKATHNPLSTQQGYFRKNQDFQRAAQDYSRFAMFHDAIKKGALAPEAAAKTRQFLMDPHNITNFERSTARRVVPFYTFLRQNMPVELKALATQPGKFVNAYESPKQEIEQNSPGQSIVPQYFKDTMSIRLPFSIGGNRTYLSPDLPFTRIGSLFSGRNQLESQTSPLIQDAIAYFNNANTFTGNNFSPYSKQAPGAWSKIPGLLQALHAIAPNEVLRSSKASTDYGVTTPKGAWEITPKAESLIESLFPPLSQARRAYTTEPNMKPRGDTSLLADLVGQNFRTNDPYQQAGELYRRQAALKNLIEQLQNQGNLPRYISGFHA